MGILFSQDRKLLPDYYTVQVEKAGVEEPIYIKKYDEKTTLKKGDYTISNKSLNFDFTIDENGIVNGEAKYIYKRQPDYAAFILYNNGFIVKSQTINITDSTVFSEIELNDSILTERRFYPSGKLKEVKTTDFKIKNDAHNRICITYFENGQVEVEDNDIKQTFKVFYENGKPQRIMDDLNGFMTFYNEDGTKESHSYKDKDGTCQESFKDGIIDHKECFYEKEFITYFYKNGKLTYYKVYNRETHKENYYNASGKQIERKQSGTIGGA